MMRKLSFLLVLVALFGATFMASADPVDGCYATSSAATIKEGEFFTVTMQCDNIPTNNNVFGFQIGTTRSGDFNAAALPSTYTAGTFSSPSTGATSGVISPTNSLSGLYAVSRMSSEVVNAEDFTLGSYDVVARKDLTADGSITITFTDADFMLSNNIGASLSGWLRDTNDVTVNVTNIDLAWLSGDMVVRSDVNTISNAKLVSLILGDKTYSTTNLANYIYTFNMDPAHQYDEDGNPAGDGTLTINASADMTGHLVCSTNNINLGDTGLATSVTTKIGTAGTITLKAGDADNDGDIDNADATAIGANMGTNPGDDKDINGDGTINILDLVHVGRNFQSTAGTCGTGGV